VIAPARAARWIRIITAHYRVMLALAMLATLASMQRRRVARTEGLCMGVVLGSVAVHCVFFGGDRYHFVFAPMLAVLAGAVLPPARAPS
jgi:hypothetical protein